jgi:dihydropteroate synthase
LSSTIRKAISKRLVVAALRTKTGCPLLVRSRRKRMMGERRKRASKALQIRDRRS